MLLVGIVSTIRTMSSYWPWTTPLWNLSSCLILLSIIIILIGYVIDDWPRSFERMRDELSSLPLPPGSMGCPFIGETVLLARKGSDFYEDHLRRLGPVYKTHVLGVPYVRVVGAEQVKQVLKGEETADLKPWLPASTSKLLGKWSVLTVGGDLHRQLRRHLSSLFSAESLLLYLPRIQDVVDTKLEKWCSEKSQPLNGYRACQNLSIDLSVEMVFGVHLATSHHSMLFDAAKTFVDNLFCFPVSLPGNGKWKGMRARQKILTEIRNRLSRTSITDANFRTGCENKERRENASFVDVIMEIPQIDNVQALLEDNTMALFFASYSTVSSALCCLVFSLGRNSSVLQKLEEELDNEGLLDNGNQKLSYEVLSRLSYTLGVIKETLRMYPPVGAGFKKTCTNVTIGGFQIPKEWAIAYSIRETMKMSDLFPDRADFRPERWSEMSTKEEHNLRYHYMPFGQGKRQCLGKPLAMLYMKVFLVQLVRKCRFVLHNPNVDMTYLPVAKPADDMPVTFEKRI